MHNLLGRNHVEKRACSTYNVVDYGCKEPPENGADQTDNLYGKDACHDERS